MVPVAGSEQSQGLNPDPVTVQDGPVSSASGCTGRQCFHAELIHSGRSCRVPYTGPRGVLLPATVKSQGAGLLSALNN